MPFILNQNEFLMFNDVAGMLIKNFDVYDKN
jgi:hypothetical protein